MAGKHIKRTHSCWKAVVLQLAKLPAAGIREGSSCSVTIVAPESRSFCRMKLKSAQLCRVESTSPPQGLPRL